MLQPEEREKLERDFAEAEASVRLEGLEPTANFFAVKARILAGEISFERGQEEILAFHRTKNSAVA
jgi:hypothetical protein